MLILVRYPQIRMLIIFTNIFLSADNMAIFERVVFKNSLNVAIYLDKMIIPYASLAVFKSIEDDWWHLR